MTARATSIRPEPLSPLELPGGEVHVWALPLGERAAGAGGACLTTAERARAARFLRPADGARWAAARGGLRALLARYLHVAPERVQIVQEDRNAKPRLAGPRAGDLRFNLSHSGDVALYAFTRGREVGVDVERARPRTDVIGLARRALPADVAAELRRVPDGERAAAFLRAWTRHEARVKCLGTGLGGHEDDRGPEVAIAVVDLALEEGLCGAVAFETPVPPRDRGPLRPEPAAGEPEWRRWTLRLPPA